MYHSVYFIPDGTAIKVNNKFQGKNTWTDFHLIPSKRPVFTPFEPHLNIIDIPGTNGGLDLSDLSLAGSGWLSYERCTGSFEFLVADYDNRISNDIWVARHMKLANFLHGRLMKAVLEDDPTIYYRGRFMFEKWDPQKDWSRVTIKYDVEPSFYPVT